MQMEELKLSDNIRCVEPVLLTGSYVIIHSLVKRMRQLVYELSVVLWQNDTRHSLKKFRQVFSWSLEGGIASFSIYIWILDRLYLFN